MRKMEKIIEPTAKDEGVLLTAMIPHTPMTLNEVCLASGLPTTAASMILTMAQLRGTCKQVDCTHYMVTTSWAS